MECSYEYVLTESAVVDSRQAVNPQLGSDFYLLFVFTSLIAFYLNALFFLPFITAS
jgi:hypothetical protein